MIFFKLKSTNYIFVHIPKTAGTSIKNALSRNFQDYINLTESKNNNIFEYEDNIDEHAPVSFISPRLKEQPIYFILVVRNPWARMFSLFQHTMLRKDRNLPELLLNTLDIDTRSEYSKYFQKKSLREIKRIGIENARECFEFWLFFIGRNKKIVPLGNPNFNILPQSWWFLENDKLKENVHIFEYEKIAELENFVGVKFHTENISRFKSNSSYSQFYNENTAEYVYNLDRWVIDRFDYKID